jgi:hypothetical protein
MKKLELKNLKVKQLNKTEQENVKGGLAFLTIGYKCTYANDCPRLETHRTNCTVITGLACK